MSVNDSDEAIPLFKGCTRVPTIWGVPVTPVIIAVIVVSLLSMWISMWCLVLILPVYFVMRVATLADDKAFRIIGLLIDTKLRNRYKKFWGASSYSINTYPKKRFEE